MTCPYCEASVTDLARFCESCGKALPTPPVILPLDRKEQLFCNCPFGQSQPDDDGYCEVCGIRCTAANNRFVPMAESPDENLAVVSDIGRRHSTNEDAGAVTRLANGDVVLVIADGVSSSVNAISAATLAVKIVRDELATGPSLADAVLTMRQAIEKAHKAIIHLPNNSSMDVDGPETNIVAALKQGDQLVIGWVGDSRAYFINDDSEELLTVDDSWVEEVVQSGQFTREQALVNKQAHYITQVLGMKDGPINIHILQKKAVTAKLILLCSDGLWNYFQQTGDLVGAANKCGPQADALTLCQHLVRQANERGGHDNITVAIQRI